MHGSPRKVNEYLFEDKPALTVERIAALADCDVLVFGHTHKPWVREYGGVLFVNCGSVGKPKDRNPRGSFAVLTATDGDLSVAIERVEYNAGAVADEIREVGLPHELADHRRLPRTAPHGRIVGAGSGGLWNSRIAKPGR